MERPARGVDEGKPAPLALAVAAGVAAHLAAVAEINRHHARRLERGYLARAALPIEVSVRPHDDLRERRIARVEDAVVIGVELPQRFKAVAREAAARELRGRAEELAAVVDRAVPIEVIASQGVRAVGQSLAWQTPSRVRSNAAPASAVNVTGPSSNESTSGVLQLHSRLPDRCQADS
jgi:hypothetical protein